MRKKINPLFSFSFGEGWDEEKNKSAFLLAPLEKDGMKKKSSL
jgi:hypothetical protein